MYPESIENAAQLREALAGDVPTHPWLTCTRLEPPYGGQWVTSLLPEPALPPLPMWVQPTDSYLEDFGEAPSGFLGSPLPDPYDDRRNQTSPDVIRLDRVPIAAQPTDLTAERVPALFGPPGAAYTTLGYAVGMMRAAVVLRRIAERCQGEAERWEGQRTVVRKLRDEATTYDAVADQFDAAAVESCRFWWDDYRARAQEAAATTDGGPVTIESIPISIN